MKANQEFREWYFSLSLGTYQSYKRKILDECLINPSKFNNWLTCKAKIPQLAKPIIESIAEKKIFSE